MPRFVFALVLVLVLVPLAARGQAPDFAKLEQVVAEEMKATRTPGAAVAVVRGTEVVFAKGFGVRSTEGTEPVTADTLFRLGSTTKMFTAAAVVQLAEDGKLKLDEPIGKHVKELLPFVAALTPHHLLTHTAGLTDEGAMVGPPQDAALGAGIRAWKDDIFFTTPGRVYSYSNPGYWLAGLLAEEVEKKPFADVLRDRLFRPLGMSRTCLRPTEAMTWPLAVGHDLPAKGTATVVRPLADNAATRPAGQVFSSANDLSRWAVAFLNGGELDGKKVLTPSLIEKLGTGHVEVPGTSAKYGYGLSTGTARGVKFAEHSGSRTGYGSIIRFVPEHKVAVIVLVNRTGGQLPKTLEAASEAVLPLAKKEAAEQTVGKPVTEAEAAKLVGKYTNNRGTLTVTRTDDGKLEVRGVQAMGVYGRVSEWTFAGGGRRVVFVAGKDGAAEFLFTGGRAMAKVP